MAIDKVAITDLYNSLYSAVVSNYTTMWNNNEIDAETYASLVGQASNQLIVLSAELVQKQEVQDADIVLRYAELDLKNKQIEIAAAELDVKKEQQKSMYADRVLKDKQAAKLGLDNVMKNAEATRLTNPNVVYTPKYNGE